MKLLSKLLFLVLVVSACSSDEAEPLSIRETLEAKLEMDLTSDEVADLIASADVMCQIDDSVLETMWAQMDAEQLAFQDFVFSTHCEDRNEAYVLATGRLDSAVEPE